MHSYLRTVGFSKVKSRKEMQEIIQDVTLFTSQSAAAFYDKLFSSLDFTLPRAATGMFNILLQANPFLDTAPRFLL